MTRAGLAALALAAAACAHAPTPTPRPPEPPRALLRLRPLDGALRLECALEMTSEPATVGRPPPPPMSVRVTLAVDSRAGDDGAVDQRFRIARAEVSTADRPGDDTLDRGIARVLAATPLYGTATLSDRGRQTLLRVQFIGEPPDELAKHVHGLLRQLFLVLGLQLDALGTPFPEAPVGAGARWSSPASITYNGFTAEGTAAYRLAELDGAHARLEVAARLGHAPGPFPFAGAPAGGAVELVSYQATETGDAVIDRATGALARAHLVLELAGRFRLRLGGEEMVAGFTARADTRVAPP